MLILARKYGERAILEMPNGEKCIVEVTDINRCQVWLGFTANPATVKIWREELLEKMEEAK